MAIIIAGAGGFAKEVVQYLRDVDPGVRFRGFIASGEQSPDLASVAPLLCDIPDYAPEVGDECVIAVGDGRARLQLAEQLAGRGATWRSIVHPTAYVAATAAIGPGSVIAPFAFVGPHANLGAHALINAHACVGHDCVLGEGVTLSPYACVNGAVRLGDGVFMGSHALVAPRVHVEAISKVAAGSVVMRDAPRGSLLVGNPAKGRVMFR